MFACFFVNLTFLHELVTIITIIVLKLCVFELSGKFTVNNCQIIEYLDIHNFKVVLY